MYSLETISSQVTMVLRAATAMSMSWNSSPQMMQVPSGLACWTWMSAVSILGTGTATTFWPGTMGFSISTHLRSSILGMVLRFSSLMPQYFIRPLPCIRRTGRNGRPREEACSMSISTSCE